MLWQCVAVSFVVAAPLSQGRLGWDEECKVLYQELPKEGASAVIGFSVNCKEKRIMCLAVPGLVTKLLKDDMAVVNVGGVSHTISLSLVEEVKEGDYVIVHVGYALSRLDPDEAKKTLALFDEYNAAGARAAAEENA